MSCGTAQEKERTFLGQELHDNINPLLATVRLYMDAALVNSEQRTALIKESKYLVLTAVEEIRTISNSLIPKPFHQISLKEAIADLCDNISKASEIEFIADWEGADETFLSDNAKLTIFRIVQEQINNILKHAHAKEVVIALHQYKHRMQLTIRDDGAGFDVSCKRKGVGLQIISSRAALLEGEVTIHSSPGKGCELQVIFGYEGLLAANNDAA